jgi:hypothetical protein
MKRTTVVILLFVAALLAGLFLQSNAVVISPAKPVEDDSSDGKERFMQRQVGMPLDMQSVPGAVGVAGYNGTPPLLGSEPRPAPERPYEMINDVSPPGSLIGANMGPECCPSAYSGDKGCICMTGEDRKIAASRGGNRSMV